MIDTLRPSVLILGTGGTIASTGAQSTALSSYSVTESIDSLLDAVPEVNTVAKVRCEQFCNVDSRAIDNVLLLRLAKRINLMLARSEIDGIVVTHGTDTLEETAYFLNLTVKSNKPVVLTGSMRPASALSADGPLNLFNAVVTAADPASMGHGVLIVMNDRIMAARFLTKAHTTQVDAFQARDQGFLGFVYNGRAYFEQSLLAQHTAGTDFDIKTTKKLPQVDIIYDHQNSGTHFFQAAVDAGATGLVIAAPGNGSLTPNAAKGANLALKNGIVCVRASRVQDGIVSAISADRAQGMLSAHTLNPIKARILLTVALTQSKNMDTLQSWFGKY